MAMAVHALNNVSKKVSPYPQLYSVDDRRGILPETNLSIAVALDQEAYQHGMQIRDYVLPFAKDLLGTHPDSRYLRGVASLASYLRVPHVEQEWLERMLTRLGLEPQIADGALGAIALEVYVQMLTGSEKVPDLLEGSKQLLLGK